MTFLITLGVLLASVGALIWFARKAGRDSARADAAEETIDAVKDANKPLSDSELEKVRKTWKRD